MNDLTVMDIISMKAGIHQAIVDTDLALEQAKERQKKADFHAKIQENNTKFLEVLGLSTDLPRVDQYVQLDNEIKIMVGAFNPNADSDGYCVRVYVCHSLPEKWWSKDEERQHEIERQFENFWDWATPEKLAWLLANKIDELRDWCVEIVNQPEPAPFKATNKRELTRGEALEELIREIAQDQIDNQ